MQLLRHAYKTDRGDLFFEISNLDYFHYVLSPSTHTHTHMDSRWDHA
jgi:hypothetical protein